MFNGQKINSLLVERRITKKSLFEYMGTSASGLDSIIKNCNPTAEKIEQIANFFKVSIDYFFDRTVDIPDKKLTVSGNGNKVQNGDGNVMIETQAKEIEHLMQLLEEKEKAIADKERTIQILMGKG